MKLPTACLSLWFFLGVPALALFHSNQDGWTQPPPRPDRPPPPSWDRREPRNPTLSDQGQWQQVLYRLDELEKARESDRSKYGEIENGVKSLRKDVARHSDGIARMDMFAETVFERLLSLEEKQTAKDTRKWTEQAQAATATENPNNLTPEQSADETSQVSDTGNASPQLAGHPRTGHRREEEEDEEVPRVESTTVPHPCLTSSPPSRPSTEFNKTVTDSGVVARYKCKYGYSSIGGKNHVSKCDAEGKWSDVDISCNIPTICFASSPPSRPSTEINKTVTDSGVVAKYNCKYGHFNIGGKNHVSKCDAEGKWSDVDISCNNFTTCSYRYHSRIVYGGTHATTTNGRTCQKWASFKPHRHGYAKPILFTRTTWTGAESLDDVANYCRDPGLLKGSGKLWCYTTDPKHRWETCKVPECSVA
ncbi:uncharacterized protein [Haliotis asinina]|uniref:uncharacterized protein n=1 Tax=Haliotis asinina TaxID=109174 RepID=UPI0035323731